MNIKQANFELIMARKEGRGVKPNTVTYIAKLQDAVWGIVSSYYGPNRTGWIAANVFTLGLLTLAFEKKLHANGLYTYDEVTRLAGK